MTSFKLLGFSVLSVALLSACSSGKGGFDLDDVEHTPPPPPQVVPALLIKMFRPNNGSKKQ
ncbi:hypothetical protein HNR69_000768 [Histophilus somni]|nr:truncated transferrin-binding protein B precursor [Histophilus somni]MBB5151332.1 hypothetical protein [Histophilus somni]